MYEASIFILGMIVGQILLGIWGGITGRVKKVSSTVQERNKRTRTGVAQFMREVRTAFVHFVLIALLLLFVALLSGYVSF